VLFWILQRSLDHALDGYTGLTPASFEQTLTAIDRVMRGLSRAKMQKQDADLIVREYKATAHLIRHACRRGLLALEPRPAKAAALRRELAEDLREIVREYKRLWQARNRPGGLQDSVARFNQAGRDYRQI